MGASGRSVLALIAGLALGIGAHAFSAPLAAALAGVAGPVGALWLAALRMTLVPLVFALVTVGVGGLEAEGVARRLLPVTLGVFVAALLAAALGMQALLSLALDLWPPVARMGALVPADAAHAGPSFVDRLVALVPTNPVEAAAKGDIAAVVVFALAFGMGLRAAAPGPRAATTGALRGTGEAMMGIVGVVLAFAPLGIFALALKAGASVGGGIAGLMGQYVALQFFAQGTLIVACTLAAVVFARTPLLTFLKVAAGPQAIAAGTTSSMATLPAIVRAAREGLKLPEAVVDTVPAMAVSLFRAGTITSMLVGASLAARAAGLHPSPALLALTAVVAVVTSFGVVGVPAAAVAYASILPLFQTLGVSPEVIPLFVAVIALPDPAITAGNVTADLTVTAIVARLIGRSVQAAASEAEVGFGTEPLAAPPTP